MNCCLDDIILEAKCCAAGYAESYVSNLTFGNKNDIDYLLLMSYIDILKRNRTDHTHVTKKIKILPQKVDFSSLTKQNNTLALPIKEKIICEEVLIEPCLSDSEICKIVEQIKTLCSQCNCNCN